MRIAIEESGASIIAQSAPEATNALSELWRRAMDTAQWASNRAAGDHFASDIDGVWPNPSGGEVWPNPFGILHSENGGDPPKNGGDGGVPPSGEAPPGGSFEGWPPLPDWLRKAIEDALDEKALRDGRPWDPQVIEGSGTDDGGGEPQRPEGRPWDPEVVDGGADDGGGKPQGPDGGGEPQGPEPAA